MGVRGERKELGGVGKGGATWLPTKNDDIYIYICIQLIMRERERERESSADADQGCYDGKRYEEAKRIYIFFFRVAIYILRLR